MTTYTALFNRPFTSTEADSPPSIVGVLSQHFSGTMEVQHGSPSAKDWILLSLESELVYEDVEVALKLAFPLGLAPLWLIQGDIDTMRNSARDRGFHQVWSIHAMWTSQRVDEESRDLLEYINKHTERQYTSMTQLNNGQSFHAMWNALRDAVVRVKLLEKVPDLAQMEREHADLRSRSRGLLEQWIDLHNRMTDLQRQMWPGSIYVTNPHYQHNYGAMNLAIQAMCHEYMDRWAPTNDNGDPDGHFDEGVHNLGWMLINILDGNWDSSQQMQVEVEAMMEARGLPTDSRMPGDMTHERRLTAYRDIRSTFADYLDHTLANLRTHLDLAEGDVDQMIGTDGIPKDWVKPKGE